jgi:hypothetical protein
MATPLAVDNTNVETSGGKSAVALASGTEGNVGYAFTKLPKNTNQSEVGIVADRPLPVGQTTGYNPSQCNGSGNTLASHKGGGQAMAYGDGHAEFLATPRSTSDPANNIYQRLDSGLKDLKVDTFLSLNPSSNAE